MSTRRILGIVQEYEFQKRKGSAFAKLFEQLDKQELLVDVLDIKFPRLLRIFWKLANFSPDRIRWNAKDQLDVSRYKVISWIAARQLRRFSKKYDTIIQIGSIIDVTSFCKENNIMCFSYHDNNVLKYISSLPSNTVSDFRIESAISYEKKVYKQLDGIFTMSKTLADSFVRGFNLPKNKVHYAGFGCPFEIEDFNTESYGNNRILFVATHSFERKGGLLVLEAFRRIREKIPQLTLITVGRDWGIAEEGIVSKGFLDKRIPKEYEEYKAAFRTASIFVMPSYNEAFGEVFVEAMAYGIPCIGSDNGVMPELIQDNGVGFIVKTGDVDDLAAKIERLIVDIDLERELGERALKCVVNEYNWPRVIGRISEVLYKSRAENSQE